MKLHLMTWMDVEDYLKSSRGIIIPIGSTEQHGPLGPIGTDCICPTAIAEQVGEDDGILVGPTINVGMAQHHLAFPGTISLRPSTLIAVVKDYVASLYRHGFQYFYFLNGHGGNIATVQAAFAEIYGARSFHPNADKPAPRCKLANWYMMPEVAKFSRALYGDKEGNHATPSEIAVTQHVFPESIRTAVLQAAPASLRPATDADDFRRLFPDGRIQADSSLARPEHGARLVELCTEAVRKDYADFINAG